MKKKIAMMCMAVVLCLCSGITTYAAPEMMADGTVFDAEYYAQNNPDVAAVMGAGKDALYLHYTMFGRNEGRLPHALATDESKQNSGNILYIFPASSKKVNVLPNRSSIAYGQAQIKINKPIKRMIEYYNNGSKSACDYIYDSRGKLIKEIEYTSKGAIFDQKVYSYDAYGRLIRQDVYSKDNILSSWCDYSYDSQGNLISEYNHHNNWEGIFVSDIMEKYDYKYDALGRLIQKIEYDYDGSIKYRHEFSYDALGRLIKDTNYAYYLNVGSLFSWVDYTYDNNGNMIRLIDYTKYGMSLWYDFAYDSKGRMISEVGYNGDNSFREQYTYSYGSDGNLIKEDEIYANNGHLEKRGFECIY